MRNRGLRNPTRKAILFGVIALAGMASVTLGIWEMVAAGGETRRSPAMMLFGLLAGTLGTALFVNYLRAARIVAAMRGGGAAIARWTVPPDQFARFRESDRRLSEHSHRNDYVPPRQVSPEGVEVIFGSDGVLIGDSFFPLSTSGTSRIIGAGVRSGDPAMIEFHRVLSRISNLHAITVTKSFGKLRLPIANDHAVEGSRVAQHFQDVIERRTIVKPQHWTNRINFGLVVTLVAAASAAIGFLLRERNQELANIPLVLAVAGTIITIGGLVMVALGRSQRSRQYRR